MRICILPKPMVNPSRIPFIPYNHDPDTWSPGTSCSLEPQTCFQGMNFPQVHPLFQHSSKINPEVLVFVVVHLPSHTWLFVTPWTAAQQAFLSVTISQSLPKFMSIASLMPSSCLILWRPLLLLPSIFPASENFPMSWLFLSDDQNAGVSASASFLPMNIQGWFPLKLTGLILVGEVIF